MKNKTIEILKDKSIINKLNGIHSNDRTIEFRCKIGILKIKFSVFNFVEKNNNQSTIFYKKISDIHINGIRLQEISFNSEEYNILVSNFFEKRNNHYIPQKIINSWMLETDNYYTLKNKKNKDKIHYGFEKRSTESIFTVHDGYVFIDGNELITIEDGFISFIENTHIFKLKEYVKKTKKTKIFGHKFLNKNTNIIKSISILLYYNLMINKKDRLLDTFKTIIDNSKDFKNYNDVSNLYADISLEFIKKHFPDPDCWGICKLNESSFILTDAWMQNFKKSADTDGFMSSMTLLIPITPKVAFVFAKSETEFKTLSKDIEIHIKEYNKAIIQYLFDNKIWNGMLCADNKTKEFVKNYASNMDYDYLCQKQEITVGSHGEKIYDNITLNNWTNHSTLIKLIRYNINN